MSGAVDRRANSNGESPDAGVLEAAGGMNRTSHAYRETDESGMNRITNAPGSHKLFGFDPVLAA